eukprot:TRINITY_DN1588_c0_g1_i1.p1 TRINITY_DN1588_c0_g1~~TRINITY_DN1588_c0_g1_i1.p1  ORF type:complete len:176 (+),score=30.12 TRINITY_DN1588_c0_g1_i1:34-561(+)
MEDAYNASTDGFKVIGLPLFLILSTFYIFWLVWRLRASLGLQISNLGLHRSVVLYGSFLAILLSIFLFYTAAWAYAVVNIIVSLVVITGMCADAIGPKYLGALLATHTLLLIGLPAIIGPGIWTQIAGCSTWYNTYADTLCTDGWLTFSEFAASLVIVQNVANTFTFLSMLFGSL